jgi:NADH dehydrogenase
VIWAAGVAASALGEALARRTGARTDGGGRPVVAPDLTLPGHPEIRVVGDLAHAREPEADTPLPGVAQVAIQQGRYAGRAVAAAVAGRTPRPFRYKDPGAVATIGRNRAVAEVHGIRLSGYAAWLLWAVLHVASLVGHLNRAVVMIRWAWSYLLRTRGGRLITTSSPPPTT